MHYIDLIFIIAKLVPRPPISKIPASNFWRFEHSVNVISIKVAQSDVGYPVKVYGTVLARDQYDYRCIYLFKRGRDNPQLIKSKVLFTTYIITMLFTLFDSYIADCYIVPFQSLCTCVRAEGCASFNRPVPSTRCDRQHVLRGAPEDQERQRRCSRRQRFQQRFAGAQRQPSHAATHGRPDTKLPQHIDDAVLARSTRCPSFPSSQNLKIVAFQWQSDCLDNRKQKQDHSV